MISIIKKTSFLFISIFLLYSCSSVLDRTPPNIISEEEAFKTSAGVMAALSKLYSEAPFEDFLFGQGAGDLGFPGKEQETLTGYALHVPNNDAGSAFINGNGDMGDSWFNYSAIRNINKFIANIDKYSANFDASQVSGWKGEALVLRAWGYYAMAKRYGGVPIVDKVIDYDASGDITALQIPRNSEKETWDFVLNDLDAAIAILPGSIGDGRVNRYVALTLKARTALYAASIARFNTIVKTDNKTNKQLQGIPSSEDAAYYTTALKAAQEVISKGGYSLVTSESDDPQAQSESYRKMFLNPQSNNEDIMVKYYNYPDYTHGYDVAHTPWGRFKGGCGSPTVDLLELYEYLDGRPGTVNIPVVGQYSALYEKRKDFFAGRDYRMAATVMYPGDDFQSVDQTVTDFDIKAGEIENGTGKELTDINYRGVWGMGANDQTQTGMLLKKYLDDTRLHSPAAMESAQPWIVMRYAEVLLIAAEAAMETGDLPTALPLINKIRTRAGLKALPGPASVTREEVRRQWTVELAFENQNLWQMRRWRTYLPKTSSTFRERAVQPMLDQATGKWKFKVALTGKGKLFQPIYYYNAIPSGEIQKNPNLIQNLGYN